MERLKALEVVKLVKYIVPLVVLVPEDGLTDSQKLEIAKAESVGNIVVMIMRD